MWHFLAMIQIWTSPKADEFNARLPAVVLFRLFSDYDTKVDKSKAKQLTLVPADISYNNYLYFYTSFLNCSSLKTDVFLWRNHFIMWSCFAEFKTAPLKNIENEINVIDILTKLHPNLKARHYPMMSPCYIDDWPKKDKIFDQTVLSLNLIVRSARNKANTYKSPARFTVWLWMT